VWGGLYRRQDTIATPHDLGESDLQRACESRFHLQRMFRIDAGARWPWLGGGFAKARNQSEREGGDHKEDDEKWQQREK
jgi:hypothetical protein